MWFALDSDFLDCGDGDLRSSALSLSRRRVSTAKDTMNRLYVVENRFTLTARWRTIACVVRESDPGVCVRPGRQKIAVATKDAGLFSTIATLKAPKARGKIRRTMAD